MRFFQNGPSIPDDLLTARDEGRVVFFCGAGVSRARVGLSDFFNLAEKVIQRLGVPKDSPTLKILKEAKEIEVSVDQGCVVGGCGGYIAVCICPCCRCGAGCRDA